MTASGSRLARIMRVLTDIGVFMTALVFVLLTIWLITSSVRIARGTMDGDVTVMVVVGSSSLAPELPVDVTASRTGLIREPALVHAQGELRFRTDSWWLNFTSIKTLIGLLVMLYGFVLLRNLLRDVEMGAPFTPINGKRIRMLGALFLVVGVLAPVIEFAVGHVVLSNAVTISPDLSPSFPFSSDAIFAGLLLLVLSQIWVRGTELEEDRALTV